MKIGWVIGLIVLLIVLIVGSIFVILNSGSDNTDTGDQQDTGTGSGSTQVPDSGGSGTVSGTGVEHVIDMTSSGFSPNILEINAGDKVTWVNTGDNGRWPATNVHPTHTVYPGSGISKCGTPQETEIFDACRILETGETYSFIFTEVGEWEYHDHISPSTRGTIVVS